MASQYPSPHYQQNHLKTLKMALTKLSSPLPFPLFPPLSQLFPLPPKPSPTQINMSRWNNANAQKHINHEQRALQNIEKELRFQRRYHSAEIITNTIINSPTKPSKNTTSFKSVGTPSSPSRPSIPGKKSKYSKPDLHPAFRKLKNKHYQPNPEGLVPYPQGGEGKEMHGTVELGESGLAYKIPNAPFEFQYSYTETPKVKPLALREPAYVPFGPSTMARPWTGRAPLSKKKLPEFDSFNLPPPGKKGVKPVQRPGPFLAGIGPKSGMSKEEVLGEALTEEEMKMLVHTCMNTTRQLNMGRDGLTHNMLDNIHAHWKRRRVCKIKCKGVCTVDMQNVHQQLEEKTGGKIIYSRGGVLFLFRGRNYNYRTRPRYPLMLWKPVTPVYPRLIKHLPEGLTLPEASEMRKRGCNLPAICKLGKNGVYSNLAGQVREAFEECDLVRINCEGMNPSDFKKIGGKLKDLVPCILISFADEHILMWRGRDWKSSFVKSEDFSMEIKECQKTDAVINPLSYDGSVTIDKEASVLRAQGLELVTSSRSSGIESERVEGSEDLSHSAREDDLDVPFTCEPLKESLDGTNVLEHAKPSSPVLDGVLLLWKQAIQSGSAVTLEDAAVDANLIYSRSVSLAKDAPSGPVFKNKPRKVFVRTDKEPGTRVEEVKEVMSVSRRTMEKKSPRKQLPMKDFKEVYPNQLPLGSLGVDDLAKLLA